MTTDITGGLVRIKDGVKKQEDYAPSREVTVELRFDNVEGTDYNLILDQACNAANRKVAELLGKSQAADVKPEKAPKATKAAKPPSADPAGMVETKAVVADPGSVTGQAISTGGERVDPGVMADAAKVEDVFTSAPAEINDNHLMSAITRKNAETKNALAIRALIGKYVPQDGKPHQAAEIEKGKRQAFLTELETIAKAVA